MKYTIFSIILCFFVSANAHDDALQRLHKTTEDLVSELEPLEEDALFEEVCGIASDLYAKLVEVTAFYYINDSFGYSKILHERLLLDIGKDVVEIIKLCTLYIPKLICNSKISWKMKLKKISYILATAAILSLWIKECCSSDGMFFSSKNNLRDQFPEPFAGMYRPGIPNIK